MTVTDTPEARTIARAAERCAQLRSEPALVDGKITVGGLAVIAAATPETLDDAFTQVLALLLPGEIAAAFGPDPVREVLWLRNRLNADRAGWLGRRSVLTVPVLVLDDNLRPVGERTVSLPC